MAKRRNNRTAGHNFERDIAARYREIFPHIVTSRSENRTRDNQGIDFVNKDEAVTGRLPLNIQAKKTTSLNYQVLEDIPKLEGVLNVVIHRKTKRKGSLIMSEGTYVIMHEQDFFDLMASKYKL